MAESPWTAHPSEETQADIAANVLQEIVNPRGLSQSEQKEAEAVVRAEFSKIKVALRKMEKAVKGLADVSQKSTLERFVSAWIVANTETEQDAHELVQHLSGVLHLYISAGLIGKDAPFSNPSAAG